MKNPASIPKGILMRASGFMVLLLLGGETKTGMAQESVVELSGEEVILATSAARIIRLEDPFNIINFVALDEEAKIIEPHTRTRIPRENIRVEQIPEKEIPEEEVGPEPGKVHPTLLTLLNEDPEAVVPVLVNLQDNLEIPRFPDLPSGAARESNVGQLVIEERKKLIEKLLKARIRAQAPLKAFPMRVQEQFWIVNAFLAEIAMRDISLLAEFPEVLFIQPQFGGEEPPDHDGNPNNDTIDGRARINSDPYFNLGLTSGFIGLLDTGIRIPAHTLLDPPIDAPFYRDCVNGGANCVNTGNPAYNPNDDCWNHGTSSAGIIQANLNKGIDFRGVTGITLDSFKVYPTGCGGLDTAAVLRGIQAAIAVLDSVIVYEMQANEPETGVIATAADNAYNNLRIINIAANGNFGPAPSTVRSPAIAHKVIGVGAYNVESPTTPVAAFSGRGPATDGRFKPDITAPTDTETASAASATAMQSFGGTSGATPYAGGAAMLLRNWLRLFGTFDNGQVYSQIIEAGQRPWPFDNNEGAGALQLITCAGAFWGKASVASTGAVIEIPLGIAPPRDQGFEAALWWPESASESHDDIDLKLINPAGAVVASSLSGVSVFERLRVADSLATGTWKLRIEGFSVTSAPQTVYWSADARGC
jgi:serine protease AprX